MMVCGYVIMMWWMCYNGVWMCRDGVWICHDGVSLCHNDVVDVL